MAETPTQIANNALDVIGVDQQIGDIEEGSRTANVCNRAYGKCRKELLRGAPWSFARKQVPLVLLADSSGATPNVKTTVPGTNFVYSYQYPVDCMRMRYIPWNPFQNPGVPAGNIVPPDSGAPLTSAPQSPSVQWQPIRPSLFLVTNDPNFPAPADSNWQSVQGQSPAGSTVILSNVPKASIVYTFDAVYISLWDVLFRGALISYIASEIAVALWTKNPAIGLKHQANQIALTKSKVMEARIADGNEMSVSTSHIPDWMRARNSGGYRGWNNAYGTGGGGDWGIWGSGWAGSMSFSDGSAY